MINNSNSLLNLYKKILANPQRWNYYGYNNGISWDCLFDSEECAKEFVEGYFTRGGKHNVFSIDYSKMSGRGRWSHVVSVFLMGLLLGPKLLKVDFSRKNREGNHSNLYLWYLTCLYHDFGYVFENNKHINSIATSIESDLNITRTSNVLEDIYYYYSTCEFQQPTVEAYYNLRFEKGGLRDHGVAGGILLFHELSNILRHKLNGKRTVVDSDHHKWSTNQYKVFARCANAIIAHNMWFNTYKEVEELILEGGNKHAYRDWLTALLILCDTIEPIKRFYCCKPNVVLDNISFKIDGKGLIIDMREWHCCNYDVLGKQCKSLEDWTGITVDFLNEGIIKLENVSSTLNRRI